MADLQNQPFKFHFDETATKQVKKQYDGCSTCFGLWSKDISTTYCGSIYVGQCPAYDMVVHFHDIMKKAALNSKLMLI